MGKKKKHPYRHTGKLLPVRTAEQIRQEVETGIRKPKTPGTDLDIYRDAIRKLKNAERELSQGDEATYLDRVAPLSEALTWIDMFEGYWTNAEGEPIPVSAVDAENLAFNAIRIGLLIERAHLRFLEAYAVDGIEQSERGTRQAERNQENAFSITREELLDRCRTAYRRHQCNQKELCDHVAQSLPIGGERVRKLLQEHGIRKSDYA